MTDRHEIDELTGAVSLGLLSQDVVLAIGRVRRAEPLTDSDSHSLRGGKFLLDRLASDAPSLVQSEHPRQMQDDVADREVFRAVRIQSPDEPAREFLARLALVLDHALVGTLAVDEADTIKIAQNLFAQVGDLALTRTNDLFERSHSEQFQWTDTSKRSLF